MTFNSYTFLVFFAILYPLYLTAGHRRQNRLLLAASYVFYGWWDWRFLFLIALSTGVDFILGKWIDATDDPKRKKTYLVCSMVFNLCLLGFFKYFDFFANGLRESLLALGVEAPMPVLHVLLPVGISFYTFQSMSYIIDIYRGHLKAERKLEDFALFVSFFPQLVAGPISRATDLLPQVKEQRSVAWNNVSEGIFLIFWGLFKKVYVADNCAQLANQAFGDPSLHSGISLLIGLYAFAFQIYCDFSGYTDMARGLAKMMGFELALNFNLPYFSLNPTEFWRRWHISLSTWLKDYLYISLGGNRKGTWMTYRNLFLTMLLGGLWHGAAWNFVLWGAYQGVLLIGHRLALPWLRLLPVRNGASMVLWTALRWLATFHLVCLGWLFFRAGSLAEIGQYLAGIFGRFSVDADTRVWAISLFSYTWLLIGMQIVQAYTRNLGFYPRLALPARIAFVSCAMYLLTAYGAKSESFIYFQF